jgi:hypothetical protein
LVDWMNKKLILYDPLQHRSNYVVLSRVVKEYVKKILLPDLYEEHHEIRFRQRDGVNCGMYIVLYAENYVKDTLKEYEKVIKIQSNIERARFQLFKRIMNDS